MQRNVLKNRIYYRNNKIKVMYNKIKIDDFIDSELLIDKNLGHNLINYLDENRDCLLSEEGDIVESIEMKDRDDYMRLRDTCFPSESLNLKGNYIPEKYFAETAIAQRIKQKLTEIVNSNLHTVTFLCASKSMGKTLSQNIWLKENDSLLESKKIFWIRCDCEKLLTLIKNNGIEFKDIQSDIIEEYFDIQFLNVFAKNYNNADCPFFQQIFKELETDKFKKRISKDRKEKKEEDISIQEEIKSIHQLILQSKSKGSKYNYGRESVLIGSMQRGNYSKTTLNNWINLSREIQKKLIKEGYHFLRIIDSVDNYKKYTLDGKYDLHYKFILDKICLFNNKYLENRKEEGHVVIIARKNTKWDYRSIANEKKQDSRHGEEIMFPRIEDSFIEQNRINIVHRRKKYIDENENLKGSRAISMFNKIESYKSKDEFLNAFWESNKNIGYYLRNQVSLIPALMFFTDKYVKDKQNDDIFINSFINDYLAVNLLLNGKFTPDSFIRGNFNVELGKLLFNPFYYKNTNVKKWQGLCCTRILQFLKTNQSIAKSTLVYTINKLFDYDNDEIVRQIFMMMDFTMIRWCGDEENKADNPKLEITVKGKATLDLVYSNIDLLYICSLDSPVPKVLIDKNYISPHSNKFNERNYAINCLKSSLTFIQYIKNIDVEERAHIDNLNIEGFDSAPYILPWNSNNEIKQSIKARLYRLENSLNDIQKEKFMSFISEFREFVEKQPQDNKREESAGLQQIDNNEKDKDNMKRKSKESGVVHVMIAAPKDVDMEFIALNLSLDFNDGVYRTHCEHTLIVHTFKYLPPQEGYPQDVIDKKLIKNKKIDIIVAVFKHKLGSPVVSALSGKKADSGTLWELYQTLDKTNPKRPLGMAYFCEIPPEQMSNQETVDAWSDVLKAKESLNNTMIYSSYSNREDLLGKIKKDLAERIKQDFKKQNPER
jgi:hypothetical protein